MIFYCTIALNEVNLDYPIESLRMNVTTQSAVEFFR